MLVNISVVVAIILVFTYYFYTTELKGPLKQANTVGRWILYLAFGVLFAQTYMGRLGLLLGRLQEFVTPYYPNFTVTIIIVGTMLITTWLLHKRYPELLEKLTPE